jgi:hypothetical protein
MGVDRQDILSTYPLATDAMTDLHADAHAYGVTRIFPRIGGTDTTREIIDLPERSA